MSSAHAACVAAGLLASVAAGPADRQPAAPPPAIAPILPPHKVISRLWDELGATVHAADARKRMESLRRKRV